MKSSSRLLAILLLGSILLGGSRAARAEGEAVQAVRVEGLSTVGEAYVRSRLRTAAGAPLSESVLDEDIGRLYQTGYFAEVRVRREAVPGGLVLVVSLKENPLVVEVKLRGNKRLSDSKLNALMRSALKEGESRYLSEADMALDLKAIEAAYKEKAFLFVRVSKALEPAEGGQRLAFQVDEGAPVPVKAIRFRGNEAFSDRKLRKGGPVLTKKKFWFFRPGALDLEVLKDDADRVRDFYRARGWLDASVSASPQVDPGRKRSEIVFDIAEGERYRIGKVAFQISGLEGKPPAVDTAALLPKFKTRAGAFFSLDHVTHDVEKIKEEYGNLGRLVTNAVPRYHYDTVGKAVEVTFEIQEGPPVRIGRVEVEGNSRTRDKIVRRQMTLHPDDPFNYAGLKKSLKRIHNLRFFDTTQVRLDEVEDPGVRDLVLEVKEAKTGRFNYGAGYSDDAGLFGLVRITQSNFDSADLRGFPWNAGRFFLGDSYVGGGQGFSISATPGQRLTSYDLGYSEPWLYDRPVGLGFNLFHRTRDLVDFQRRDEGGNLSLNRRFGESWTLGATLSTSRVTVFDVPLDAPQALRDSEGSVSINSVSPFLRWDTRDDPYLPSTGRMNQVTYEWGGGPLGGVDYWRGTEEYQHFWTLSQDEDELRRHILSFWGRTGVVDSHGGTHELPVFLQYFGGGSSTIRGFGVNAVGPKEDGTVVGGRFFLFTSLEYTFPLYEEILRGAAFVDRGTVERSIHDNKPLDEFRSAWGFGLRIQLPISPLPVSLDLAFPLEKQDGDSLRSFSFSFGTVF